MTVRKRILVRPGSERPVQTAYSSSYRCVPSSSTVKWNEPAIPSSAPLPDPGTTS